MTRQAGFTLIETLVALFVFALIAGMATFILGSSAEASRHVEAASEELQALQRTRAALRGDLSMMAPRPTRGPEGDMRPPLTGTDDDGTLIAFVRRGPPNLGENVRPGMQYVEWLANSEGLVRRASRHLDGAEPGPDALLLPGARDIGIAFNVEGAWSDRLDPDAPQPAAIRLTLTHPRFGRVEQLFLTGAVS